MTLTRFAMLLGCLAVASGESGSRAIVSNIDTANWTHEAREPAGSGSVVLHTDETTGGMDLLVRYPAGHVIAPHFHYSNERLFVVEGQLTLRQDKGDAVINAGGYAFLPAREIQRMSCNSKMRCTFYLSWDGKPASHAAK
jgi:quercetin dioxygenase-like cupin family protein